MIAETDVYVAEPTNVEKELWEREQRIEGLLRYLEESLTSRLPVPQPVYALRIYNETEDGEEYSLRPADDISNQGDACTDDICRAIVLACDFHRLTGSVRAARLARRWSSFLTHVEIRNRPGIYAPFVFADGRLNIGGYNSRPPSKWAQGNVARASARLWQVFLDDSAQDRFWQVVRKNSPDLKATANRVDADLTAYEVCIDMNDVRAAQCLRPRITRDIERIIANRSREGYFLDFTPGSTPDRLNGSVQLWGYHQLAAVARAARLLRRADWLQPCVETMQNLIDPLLENWSALPHGWPVDSRGHPIAWPDKPARWTGTAYHVSSLVAGLTELYLATDDEDFADRALRISGWLTGYNAAGESMYHPRIGGCYDGILDGAVNRNLGAESSIEAGRAELNAMRCLVAASKPCSLPEPISLVR